ncbi:L,D-transpeptidase family protein [Flavobacterium sp. MAH-1]|uniref:L,D-transpeptidase family protein n=1 Tax=Flavobacterium agri TaxID=2743471 RepID=A0A7Y8Y337_9FLAO|nr:L,D-transpeptidase family protein [Flavobacterium agri]NUY81690.1 L,D-transpeptidase family protein [Flavobacterium agri]NYA71714.1 L,D-transpeptidase family protein [Flavobacterium agri]
MRKILLLTFLAVAVLGCKKDPKSKPKTDEPLVKHEPGSVLFDSSEVVKLEDKQLTAFYRAQNFHTFWVDSTKRKKAETILAEAEKYGLDPKDYYLEKIRKYEKKYLDLSQDDHLTYDFLLTQSVRRFMIHVSCGKLNPYHIYPNWDLAQPSFNVNKTLAEAVSGDSLPKVISKIEPQHVVYKRLKKALAYLDTFGKDTLKQIVFTEKIKRGDSSENVIRIKRRLMFWRDMERTDSISPWYDRKTANAMKKFQLRHGLIPDGIAGAGTVAALNFTKIQRKQQVIVNLERWRWFPHEMGRQYVIVNIPDYRLRVIKNGDTVDTRRVVVGKEKRRTPVLSSTFTDVILNPTWTVPPTIIKEDLGPDAAKDTNYFRNRRLKIFNSKGEEIPSSKWNSAKPNNYRYVQDPGDDNSLGNVKFNFRNRFTVYLHDTNHRDYFSRNYRSLSSGCVRVQNPLPLAAYLINDSIRWNLDKINEVVATKETTYIRLKDKTRIHQLYWTAWMNKRGELEFREDIYNYDADLFKRLRQ